jgi:hypothetical protein
VIGKPVVIDGVVIQDYVASQDLNECVEALLTKGSKHFTAKNPPTSMQTLKNMEYEKG